MFGDSSTVADVRLLLAKQQGTNENSDLYSALGLENLEMTLINSLRYLMSAHRDSADERTSETENSVDVEAGIRMDAVEGRIGVNEDNLKLAESEDQIKQEIMGTYDSRTRSEVVDIETKPSLNDKHAEEYQCNCGESKTDTSEGLNILHLPVQALLYVFSFLDARDISAVGSTCRQCYSLCADQILWRDFLEKDKLLWQQVSHCSNPALYEAVNSDLTYREIYMRCSPQFQRESSGFNLLKLPQLLWSFIPHKPPKVVMFGPGLESNTSTLVRKFLGNESDVFKVCGVFPAELPGVGTGFVVSMNNKVDMRLITMYSGTRRDRENPSVARNRAQRNKLLQAVPGFVNPQGGKAGGQEVEAYEPTSTIKELCRNVDAFIFVVDASLELETIGDSQVELFAMMNERWTSTRCPLVILSCVPDSTSSRVPCVMVAKQLDLHKLNRIWKMFDANVTDLTGVVEAITWLVEGSQR